MSDTAPFADHFSAKASTYARHRPTYPDGLYRTLVDHAPQTKLCWDCATGSGQAARSLVAYFDRVVATDASSAQLSRAQSHPRIDYRVAHAEHSGLDDQSVDMVTAAAAIHWFDLDRFYTEVRRVARPGAVVAAWSYTAGIVMDDAIDPVMRHFADETLGPYWPEQFEYQRTHYGSLPFPFEPIEMPPFSAVCHWSLDDLLAGVSSWSGYKLYVDATGHDPSGDLRARLEPVWGRTPDGAFLVRRVEWPLHFKVGRIR